MEAAYYAETSVDFTRTTRRYILKKIVLILCFSENEMPWFISLLNWSKIYKDLTLFIAVCFAHIVTHYLDFKPDNGVILSKTAWPIVQFSAASSEVYVRTRKRDIWYFLPLHGSQSNAVIHGTEVLRPGKPTSHITGTILWLSQDVISSAIQWHSYGLFGVITITNDAIK
jgi:hypothetical protein